MAFSDRSGLESDVKTLIALGFRPPKWSFGYDVAISELTCSKRKLLCDIVAYRDGVPVLVFERDGAHHNLEPQQARDDAKERMLRCHGIRLWRWWNSEAEKAGNGAGRVFRRYVKALLYARQGSLRSDYKHLCKCKVR